MTIEEIKNQIRDIPDFPKKGIIFKDIAPLLGNAETFNSIINLFKERYKDKNITRVVGIETRGLILASAVAYALGTGLALIRKPGKLPYKTHQTVYELEYGTDKIEIHTDALNPKERIIIVDDLLATGGTAKAAAELVKKLDAEVVEIAFLIELLFLKGKDRLNKYPVFSFIHI